MKRPHGRFTEFLSENRGLKLASLLIAILLWAWVMSGQQSEESFNLTLRLNDTPDNIIVTNDLPRDVNLRLAGSRPILNSLRGSKLYYDLDLSDLKEGSSTFDIIASRLGLPPGLVVSAISPQQINIQADKKIRKVLQVKPVKKGVPADGFEVTEMKVYPKEVECVGPERRLKALKEITTEPVDVTGLSGNITKNLGLSSADNTVRPVKEREVLVEVLVHEIGGLKQFTSVPVTAPEGFTPRPAVVAVTVAGRMALLNSLAMKDIKAKAILDDVEKDPIGAYIRVNLPEGVRAINIDPEEIELVKKP